MIDWTNLTIDDLDVDRTDFGMEDLFYFFGAALSFIQGLETQLMNMLLTAARKKHPSMKRDEFMRIKAELQDKKTLGSLIRDVKKIVHIEGDLEDRLKVITENRNILVHHFFRQHFHEIQTSEGRRKWIRQIAELVDVIEETDSMLERLVL